MLDWQVHEEEQPLASDYQEGPPSRGVKDWLRFGALLLLLLVVGLFVFRLRVTERTEAMQSDLKVFIRHEEQQRLFGLSEATYKLTVSDAPDIWQKAYRSTFVKTDEVKPVEVAVKEIELDGTDAYVTVLLDGTPQHRFYQLVEQKWRRAPFSDEFWGQTRELYIARQDITISYRAHDEAFAQTLVAELPSILSQWPIKKAIRKIQITHREFAPALLDVEETQITVNSPSLLLPGDTDSEATARLQLADNLFAGVTLEREVDLLPLPGTITFSEAIRTTFILRWALPNQMIPRQIWQKQVENSWQSPFFSKSRTDKKEQLLSRVWQPSVSEAAALLMADYLYEQYGAEGLQHVIQELPTVPSWDSIFYPLTNHYTIEIEEQLVSNDKEAKKRALNVPELPLDVALLDMDIDNNILNFEIQHGEEQDRLDSVQLSVDVEQSTLSGLQRVVSSGRCAALHKKLTITEADWLKVGQKLQARQLVVSRSFPSISLPNDRTLAPTDTLAYLVEKEPSKEGKATKQSVIALSDAGEVTHLTTLPSLMNVGWRIPSKTSRRARFLLTLSLPECEEAWFFLYDPRRGILSRWFASFSEFSVLLRDFVWNPLEGEVLLTRSTAYESHPLLSAEGPIVPKEQQYAQANLSNARYPLSWRSNQAVVLDGKKGTVKLIDVALGKVTQILPLSSENAHLFMLSEDENRLFYAHAPPAKEQTFHMLDFESGQDHLLFSISAHEWLQPVVGGISNNHVLLLRAQERTTQPIATQLLLVGTSAGKPIVVMDLLPNEIVTSALVCEDNRVLMTISSQGESEVRMWEATGKIKRFFKTDKSLQLLSCY